MCFLRFLICSVLDLIALDLCSKNYMAIMLPLLFWQLILDMHFTVEIARFAGYPSRHVHQIASAITARAIRTFTARDVERYSSFLDSLISGSNFHFSSSN